MIALVAPFVEAWSQVRVHKARFILSLLGVFIAVLAMTGATAIGRMGQQIIAESLESVGGRPATLAVNVWSNGPTQPTTKQLNEAYQRFVDRHNVTWSSRNGTSLLTFSTGGPPQEVTAHVVEPAYGVIHRVKPIEGRWFTEEDRDRLSPAVVVNQPMAEQLGIAGSWQQVSLKLIGTSAHLATVIGVISGDSNTPAIYLIDDLGSPATGGGPPPTLEMWVPPDDAAAVSDLVRAELSAIGPGINVEVWRNDGGAISSTLDSVLTKVVIWVGILLLTLGALGVVNVAIVTVKQRIREIGVRRSFGATSGRVFTTVLLETTLATALAGAAAVAVAVATVPRLPINEWVGESLSITDVPPFPMAVALQGVLAATVVGLLAGLIPAIIAVRANPVEAIRF